MSENDSVRSRLARLIKYWSNALRWPVILGVGLTTLVLGYVGLRNYLVEVGAPHGFLDVLYVDLQLFTWEWVSVGSSDIGWQLEIARWLAPAVTLATAIKGLGYVFRDQLRVWSVGRARGHVVIAGAGQKGLLLARSLIGDGHRVAVIERDAASDLVESCRAAGAAVVIGDARDGEVLGRAGLARAGHLLVVCGDQGVNVEVAARASELVAGVDKGLPLTCLVHIVDPRLCRLLRARQLGSGSTERFRMDFFNVYEMGARALLHDHPLPSHTGREGPLIAVIGLSELGRAVILRAARRWKAMQLATEAPSPPLGVLAIDPDATQIVATMRRRYPGLATTCEIRPVDVDTESPEYEHGEFLSGAGQPGAVYVCVEGDAGALSAALIAHHHLGDPSVPVVAASTTDGGLTSLSRNDDASGPFSSLQPFRLLNRTCAPDVVLGGTYEVIARAMHDDYLRRGRARDETPATNRSLVPWGDLPRALQESNRAQAAHIGWKLHAASCRLEPLAEWDADRFDFTPDEVEMLSRMEHDRWQAEREAAGWTFDPGPPDPVTETSPWLIPWDELPEQERDKDRDFIRGLPTFLADVGFEIVRADTSV